MEKNKLETSFEFINDTYEMSPESKISFNEHTRISEGVVIYKRSADKVSSFGIGSISPQDKWAVRFFSEKGRKNISFYKTLKEAKNFTETL